MAHQWKKKQSSSARWEPTIRLVVGVATMLSVAVMVPQNFLVLSVTATGSSITMMNSIMETPVTQRMLSEQEQPEGSSAHTAIFLNVFMGPKQPRNGRSIVQEQVEQLANASHHKNATLYYNIIGYNHSGPICPPGMDCQQLGYYPEANEEVTLQALHDHCVAHPADSVIYLHNKGSLHNTHLNKRLRRIGTKGALSEACTALTKPNEDEDTETSRCNVCTLKFQTFPFSHVPGNFWTAKCDYIRSLVPPREYEQERRNLCKLIVEVYNGTAEFCPSTKESIDEMKASVPFGFGRMSMERWLPSHPSFVPCVVLEEEGSKFGSFETGWEQWTPTLIASRKRSRRMSNEQRLALELQTHEYGYLYGPDLENKFCNAYFPSRGFSCPKLHEGFKARLYLEKNLTKTISEED